MVETLINFVATLLSQIFIGMVLGFCWNNSVTELGVPGISIIGAILAWLGFLTAYVVLTFTWVNMFKNVRGYVTVKVDEGGDKEAQAEK